MVTSHTLITNNGLGVVSLRPISSWVARYALAVVFRETWARGYSPSCDSARGLVGAPASLEHVSGSCRYVVVHRHGVHLLERNILLLEGRWRYLGSLTPMYALM